MAVFDTHRAFTTLVEAGFTERQAQALLDVGSEGYGALAIKDHLKWTRACGSWSCGCGTT